MTLILTFQTAFDLEPMSIDGLRDPFNLRQIQPDFGRVPTDAIENVSAPFKRFAESVLRGALTVFSILITLLWCRVILEMIIVIFNISSSLKNIEAKREGPV